MMAVLTPTPTKKAKKKKRKVKQLAITEPNRQSTVTELMEKPKPVLIAIIGITAYQILIKRKDIKIFSITLSLIN